jgi:AcrR family transcriptional regulator
MENGILTRAGSPASTRPLSRAAAARLDTYADEVERLIAATYAVIRQSGSLDPRVSDIVKKAKLSNQAFYRHFESKDELMLALLADGQAKLLDTLQRRMARAEPGAPRVQAWIEGMLAQARDETAAATTRPFTVNGLRLSEQYPLDVRASRELVIEPLRDAIADAGGDPQRDGDAIYHLAKGAMDDALMTRTRPTKSDIEHLVTFALTGLGGEPHGT